jgi:hypothetical protein
MIVSVGDSDSPQLRATFNGHQRQVVLRDLGIDVGIEPEASRRKQAALLRLQLQVVLESPRLGRLRAGRGESSTQRHRD